MNLMNNIYIQLLQAPSVPSTVQQRAVEQFCSTRRKDSELGAAILHSAGLDPELADKVCDAGGHKELAIWLAMPGRTPNEILHRIDKEKRVSVLAAVCDRDDLPPEVFERLIKASHSYKVMRQIVQNTAVDADVRVNAAAKAFNDGAIKLAAVAEMVALLPEEKIDQLVTKVTASQVLRIIAGTFALNEESVEKVVAMLQREINSVRDRTSRAQERGTLPVEDRYSSLRLDELSFSDLVKTFESLAVAGAMTAQQCDVAIGRMNALIELFDSAYASAVRSSGHDRNNFMENFHKPAKKVVQILESFSTPPDPVDPHGSYEYLEGRAQEVEACPARSTPLALAVLLHRAADYRIAKKVYDKTDRLGAIAALIKAGNEALAAEIVAKDFYYVPDFVVALAVDAGQFCVDVASHIDHRHNYSPGQAADLLKFSGERFADVLTGIPVELFSKDAFSWDDRLRTKVSEFISEKLGTNPEVWEMFETFVSDGEISIGDAVTAAIAFHEPADVAVELETDDAVTADVEDVIHGEDESEAQMRLTL